MSRKVKLKDGYSNFGHDGKEYPVAEDGFSVMDDAACEAAIEFGIVESWEQLADADPLADLLVGTVAEIKSALKELTNDELNELKILEDAGHNRKGVDDAIVSEIASRL